MKEPGRENTKVSFNEGDATYIYHRNKTAGPDKIGNEELKSFAEELSYLFSRDCSMQLLRVHMR